MSILCQVFILSGHSALFQSSKASVDFQCCSRYSAVLQFAVKGFIPDTGNMRNTISVPICEKANEMPSVIWVLYCLLLLFSEESRAIFSSHLVPYGPSCVCNKKGSSIKVAMGIAHCGERLWDLRTSVTGELVNVQRSPPPSSGAGHPSKQEFRQKCEEACMDEQGDPGQTLT